MKKNSVVAGILAILCVMSVSGCGDKEAESSTMESTTTTDTTVQTTTTAPATTTSIETKKGFLEWFLEPTSTTFTESIRIENKYPTDLSLITAKGHPTYYGSIKDAHNIWDSAEEGKVVFNQSNNYSNKTIIYISGYSEKEDIIRNIEINFKNFSEPMSFYLEDTLNIVSEYIPYDIINQWYEFYKSYCVHPIEKNSEDNTTCYVISYCLTESGKTAYGSGHSYGGTIDIVLYVNSAGSVDYFTIGLGTPRWMDSLELNHYELVEWYYNFLEN